MKKKLKDVSIAEVTKLCKRFHEDPDHCCKGCPLRLKNDDRYCLQNFEWLYKEDLEKEVDVPFVEIETHDWIYLQLKEVTIGKLFEICKVAFVRNKNTTVISTCEVCQLKSACLEYFMRPCRCLTERQLEEQIHILRERKPLTKPLAKDDKPEHLRLFEFD